MHGLLLIYHKSFSKAEINIMLRADLHIHSHYSPDSNTTIDEIIRHCIGKGINCIALTDHNCIAGAIQLRNKAPFRVIVGEEIMTDSGEMIGLFLSEEIPPFLSVEETVNRIKNQNGLVCIPHPFDRYFRPSAMKGNMLESIINSIDIIEVFNSHTVLSGDSKKAEAWAVEHNLLCSAGSDAHVAAEIGKAYVEMQDFKDIDEFKISLADGIIRGRRSSLRNRMLSAVYKLSRRLKRQ